MVWNHRIAMILLECIMLSCSYGCMRNQRKSQISSENIATKKVADSMKNMETTFPRFIVDKPVGEDFSEGQKKKVLIAKSLGEQAHLYVWDEPLNYIDIYSRMQIEQLIKEFCPTMIFVEHDLAFRNTIATKSIQLTVK